MKRRKKSERQKLETKLDALVRDKVRARGYCQIKKIDKKVKACKGFLQTAHIISRSYDRTRWLWQNVLCGCSSHHFYYTHHPDEWRQLINEQGGLYDKLWEIAWNEGKPSYEVYELEELFNKLKE